MTTTKKKEYGGAVQVKVEGATIRLLRGVTVLVNIDVTKHQGFTAATAPIQDDAIVLGRGCRGVCAPHAWVDCQGLSNACTTTDSPVRRSVVDQPNHPE
eukprot:m.403685 g.403685  ORF g.403685 m.403685 type:complete len:99 (-) comp28414_c0_seq1:1758-2054(-)